MYTKIDTILLESVLSDVYDECTALIEVQDRHFEIEMITWEPLSVITNASLLVNALSSLAFAMLELPLVQTIKIRAYPKSDRSEVSFEVEGWFDPLESPDREETEGRSVPSHNLLAAASWLRRLGASLTLNNDEVNGITRATFSLPLVREQRNQTGRLTMPHAA